MSPVFASKSGWEASRMVIPLSVVTPLSSLLGTCVFLPSYPVLIEGRELLADLVLLDVMDFDVILGMDWLSQHYATVDCLRKEVIFLEFQMMKNLSLWVTRVLHLRTLSPPLLLEKC